jgi:ABC-type sugar transport system ATPase subunit
VTAHARPASAAAWLTVRGLAKSYGGVRALRGVDLELNANMVYGVIGPNGAGKSTLVKALAGSVVADAGEIHIDGTPASIHSPAVARGYGLVLMPQEMTLVPDFTAVENVTLGAEPTRFGMRDPLACRDRARAAMDLVGLDIDPASLASGLEPVDQRLLMLAKAVSQETRLIILDEPTAGLAPAMARQVTDTVRRLRNHGLTIVYVSHHLSEVAALSDHVVCIREGRVSARLSGREISKASLVKAIVGDPAQPSAGDMSTVSEPRCPSSAGDSTGHAASQLSLEGITGSRLRNVSLTACSGQVTGLTGLLGSGVAELVDVIAGSVRPTSGRMVLDGAVVDPRSPADALAWGIGTVTGNRARSALLTRTVRDNVSVTALRKWFGPAGLIRRGEERRRVNEALASLSVDGDPERPLSSLSGGNQQRVLVSRLLAAELKVMLFDDPTVGVDVASRAQLWDELRKLARDSVVLVASGEPEELIGVCDRVICIHDGGVTDVLEGDGITDEAIAHATS